MTKIVRSSNTTSAKEAPMSKIARSIICIALSLVTLITLVGCSSTKTAEEVPVQNLSEQSQYYLELAQNAKSTQEVHLILQKEDSAELQLAMAGAKNLYVHEALLGYEKLTTKALIEIIETSRKSFLNHPAIQNLLIAAISRADLTPEEELQIAHVKTYATQFGALARKTLNSQTLIYLLDSNDVFFSTLPLGNPNLQKAFIHQVSSVPLTLDEKKELENLNIDFVNKALLEKEVILS